MKISSPTPLTNVAPVNVTDAAAAVGVEAAAARGDHKHDLTLPTGAVLLSQVTTPVGTTATVATDLVSFTGLNIAVGQRIILKFNASKTNAFAARVDFGLKLNATTVVTCTANAWGSSAAAQAETGSVIIDIAPRASAKYLLGVNSLAKWYASVARTEVAPVLATLALAADIPNAAITDVVIVAKNDGSNVGLEIGSAELWIVG